MGQLGIRQPVLSLGITSGSGGPAGASGSIQTNNGSGGFSGPGPTVSSNTITSSSGALALNGASGGTGISIAATTGNATFSGAALVNNGSGVGYTTGAGGTVSQTSNRTTAVTLNKATGQITTNNTSLAAGAGAAFTVTNSTVAATDTPHVAIVSGQVNPLTTVFVSAVAAGSFQITVYAGPTTAETGSIVINFTILKGATS